MMIGADLLRAVRDAHTLAAHAPPAAAAELATLLDSIKHHIGRLYALPLAGNAELRVLAARMDAWLLSIHDSAVIRSRPLLLTRLHMLADAARQVDAIEEARADAVTASALAGTVVPFPGALARGLRAAQARA